MMNIQTITDAIETHSTLTMTYCKPDGTQTVRVVVPRSIERYRDGRCVLRAYCSLRNDLRHFRVDRIVACESDCAAPF